MWVNEYCAKCLYDKQANLVPDDEYLKEVKNIIENRKANDTAPYMVYLFKKAYEKRFGDYVEYKSIKKKYNDFVLGLEQNIRQKIEEATNSLATALAFARIGNYIDFGAMNAIDEKAFLDLLYSARIEERDKKTFESFLAQCKTAKKFLYITDNCGEIVLDKLFIEQLKKRFPNMEVVVLTRGEDVINDVTMEDCEYVGLNKLTKIISNGTSIAGTVYSLISNEAKNEIDTADVILSKGQGNYETLSGEGLHIFYSLLCKCELFTTRFNVPQFTGIFIEEN